MCGHLLSLDKYLESIGVKETFRGKAWSVNSREWVYFECMLDLKNLRTQFSLPEFVVNHINKDHKSGTEAGFICTHCHDAIIGLYAG